MSTEILNPKHIEQASVRVSCGDEYGSGFFISAKLIITARHVVLDAIESGVEIRIEHGKRAGKKRTSTTARLIADGEEDLDIAVLEVLTTVPAALPLKKAPIRYGAKWETYGYPFEHAQLGNRYYGTVLKTNNDRPYDIQLINENSTTTMDYRGLSGAPLVIDNHIVGLLTWNTFEGFGAVSMVKAEDFLKNNRIAFVENPEADDLPQSLVDDIENVISNEDTFDQLNAVVTIGGKYYVLQGSPGTGKTTIAATFNFDRSALEIAGRYFLKLPNDDRALAYRTSREAFLEWAEDLISKKLYGVVHQKLHLNSNDRLKNFQALLRGLDTYYREKGKIGLLIIDGLDELSALTTDKSAEFLGMFPENLPANLAILFSLIRPDLIPAPILSKITFAQQIKVLPLALGDCEYYLKENLEDVLPDIGYPQLAEVARRSEGHALYLRYLLERLKEERPIDLDAWLNTLPAISGDIGIYYESLWLTDFQADADKLWIAVTAAQLRQPISAADLLLMLPEAIQLKFTTKFTSIRHLFKVNGVISVYHTSFRLFIESKAPELVQLANDRIRSFCLAYPDNRFGTANVIFHALKSSSPADGVTYCSQEWADRCALNGVEPEFILSDIQEAESFSLDLGLFTELIRLKLLQQRIRFRYNNVLAENAGLIAKVLLDLGRPAEALKYITRSGILLLGDEDALNFLRLFYQSGAETEGQILLRAIQRRYRFIFEEDKKRDAIGFRFFRLMSGTVTLGAVQDPEYSIKRIIGLLKMLDRFKEEKRNSSEQIEMLRQHISAYQTGFFVFHFGQYHRKAKDIAVQMPKVPPEEWAGRFAQTALEFEKLADDNLDTEQKKVYMELVADIEESIDLYGFKLEDGLYLWGALLEKSKRSDIVIKVLQSLKSEMPVNSLRAANGVDVDKQNFYLLFNRQQDLGYLDETDALPPITSAVNPLRWEESLIKIIEGFGFCFGKAYRASADGNTASLPLLTKSVNEYLKAINFQLDKRRYWKRAYAIPEAVLPAIYQWIIKFYVEFNVPDLAAFINDLEKHNYDQLGLYTEGYRESLSRMAAVVAGRKEHRVLAFKIIKLLDSHIDIAVQNRWERTPWLLNLAQLYLKIEDVDRANSVYQRMLDSSMGPSWYKEDQFALINTVLSISKVAELPSSVYDDFAEQLEYASGELTFQRYVRHEQQEFIHSLHQGGRLADAIKYMKYQILPAPEQVIKNAESSVIDTPVKGHGYVLGAGSLIEASAITHLLTDLEAPPLLIFALSEIFIVNDDIYRYLGAFAKIQAQCLNSATESEKEAIMASLVGLITAEELASNQHHYLKDLSEYLEEPDHAALATMLADHNIDFPAKKKTGRKDFEGDDRDDAQYDAIGFPGVGKHANLRKIPIVYQEASAALEVENTSKARKIITEGVHLLHSGEADVWMGGNLSGDFGKILKLYAEISTPEEVLTALKDEIKNHYTQDWRVANKLIELLQNKLSVDQTRLLIDIAKEHIGLMIRQPGKLAYYNWHCLSEPVSQTSAEQLREFIIWTLNHPYVDLKKRAADCIIRLCEHDQDLCNLLVSHALSAHPDLTSELCAWMFNWFAIICPEKAFVAVQHSANAFAACEHFMVRYYLLKAVESLKETSFEANDLCNQYLATFPQQLKPGGEVAIDETHLHRIEDTLVELNDLGVLNGDFVERLLRRIDEITQPIDIYEYFRAEYYIDRSFFEDNERYGIADEVLRAALNFAIIPRASQQNLKQIADILTLPFLADDETRF